MPYSKKNVRVEVPKKSGFSLKHRNSGTITCGTITPLLVEEVIPAAAISCKINIVHQLPPLASDTYMNLKVKVEAFFVPFRLLSASFESFFSDFPERVSTFGAATQPIPSFADVSGRMPVFHFADDVPSSVWGAGTLMDYCGAMIDSVQYQGGFDFNPAALEAYHLIWQEFYRNPRVQNPAFSKDLGVVSYGNGSVQAKRIVTMPYQFYRDAVGSLTSNVIANFDVNNYNTESLLADGVSIFELRQRNFGFDYFTSARPSAQQGQASTVVMPVSGSNATMTIAQLRAANSLQQFRERNNISSPRFIDQVRARYGANLADGVAQRPICIGTAVYDVVTRGVDQTADGTASANLNNPFSTVAAQYGRAYGSGSDFIIDHFVANEPGLIMINQTLVPEVTYSSGIRPYLRRYLSSGSIVEMANPILQNVGDEVIDGSTLDGDVNLVGSPFGFTDRYGSYMYHPNECHGLMRDGHSLQSFVLQRSFSGAQTISSSFLEIPKNYLDQVMAVTNQSSGLSAWYDSVIDLRVSMPLAEFSIPSLQDPAYEHGDSIVLRRNGQIF